MGRRSLSNKNIVLDVDSVLLDFCSGFVASAARVLSRQIEIEPGKENKYSMSERFRITREEERLVREALYASDFGFLPAIAGAAAAFQKLQYMGYDIHLVTGIPVACGKMRLENLAREGMVPASIHCVGDGRARKDHVIRKIGPAAFVDDRLEHLRAVASFVPHLAWIDDGTEQDGGTSEHVHHRAANIGEWLSAWVQEPHQAPRHHVRSGG